MKIVLPCFMVLFLILWYANYPVLSSKFDLESCMGQYNFWVSREIVYEFMFVLLGLVCLFSTGGLLKAISAFVVVMIIGDLVDKCVFGITDYVFGDIFLIVVGIIVSVVIYGRAKLVGQTGKPVR